VLLSLAAEAQAISTHDTIDLLQNAVTIINSLPKSNAEEDFSSQTLVDVASSEINDPRNFIDSTELQRAFMSMGRINLDNGLSIASKIEIKPIQLMARLAASEGVISKGSKKFTKMPPKTAPSSPSPKRP
jgi:DeoR/GlpR family transcriptional regulator of sugar metabolism